MTRPRKDLVSVADTPYYHITSRCVRRAFLCGTDDYSGRNYEHRRQWIVDRIRLLSSLFAIDVAAYAVMSNHYHLVIKLCPEQFDGETDNQIINRWCSLFKGPLLVQQLRAGEVLSKIEKESVCEIVNVWRKKLMSLSWFMRCLNQPIACQANAEDRCTGKFWEYRFDSKPLRTDEALLSCMAYVDLNPIRAKMASTPENSDYTSVQQRIAPSFDLAAAVKEQVALGELNYFQQALKPLLHFDDVSTVTRQTGIPYNLVYYLELVDWTGRVVRADKRGSIGSSMPNIIERLNISAKQWTINATQFEAIHRKRFSRRSQLADSA